MIHPGMMQQTIFAISTDTCDRCVPKRLYLAPGTNSGLLFELYDGGQPTTPTTTNQPKRFGVRRLANEDELVTHR